MAVSVDTVYQTVLALANKEQRGYITPQEFNLFANQASMEIFEQYFYDLNVAARTPGNDTFYSDIDDMLEQKLQIFEGEDDTTAITAYSTTPGTSTSVTSTTGVISTTITLGTSKNLPSHIYRINRVELSGVACEILKTSDFNNARTSGPLIAPSDSRPIANVRGNVLSVVGSLNKEIFPSAVFYFRKPAKVNWTYVVINKQAMFDNSGSTQNFELHSSEETNLGYKILKLAGVSSKQQDIMAAGRGMEMVTQQQQIKS